MIVCVSQWYNFVCNLHDNGWTDVSVIVKSVDVTLWRIVKDFHKNLENRSAGFNYLNDIASALTT